MADYYSVKGEAPGRWMGQGLAALADPAGAGKPGAGALAELLKVTEGSAVTEDQMKALFGEGLHPNATHITEYLTRHGVDHKRAIKAARLGAKFAVYDNPPVRRRARRGLPSAQHRRRARPARPSSTPPTRQPSEPGSPAPGSPNNTGARPPTIANCPGI